MDQLTTFGPGLAVLVHLNNQLQHNPWVRDDGTHKHQNGTRLAGWQSGTRLIGYVRRSRDFDAAERALVVLVLHYVLARARDRRRRVALPVQCNEGAEARCGGDGDQCSAAT